MKEKITVDNLEFEILQRVAFFTGKACTARFTEVLNPMEYIDIIKLDQEIEADIKSYRKGLVSLSLTSRRWHNAAQPILANSVALCSIKADMWSTILTPLLNKGPLFVHHEKAQDLFYNVNFTDVDDVLKTSVNHITLLTELHIDVSSAIPREILNEFRDLFLEEASNLKSLTVSISKVHEYEDYHVIVTCLLNQIDRLHFLDWSCTYGDAGTLFFEFLDGAENLRRANLSLCNVTISEDEFIGGSIPKLECLQIGSCRGSLGNQFDLLAGWDMPNFQTVIINDYHVYGRLRMLLEHQYTHLKHLFMKHVWRNEDVLMICSDIEVLYADMRYMPHATYGAPWHAPAIDFCHPSLRKIILAEFDRSDINYVVLYRMCNKYYFPELEEVQILDFNTGEFRIADGEEGWAHDVAQWLTICSILGLRVTDKNGSLMNLVEGQIGE